MKSVPAILTAATFAAEKHASQKRKGVAAEPYVNDLLEVAHLVSTAMTEPDTNLFLAALLHDHIPCSSLFANFDKPVVVVKTKIRQFSTSLPQSSN